MKQRDGAWPATCHVPASKSPRPAAVSASGRRRKPGKCVLCYQSSRSTKMPIQIIPIKDAHNTAAHRGRSLTLVISASLCLRIRSRPPPRRGPRPPPPELLRDSPPKHNLEQLSRRRRTAPPSRETSRIATWQQPRARSRHPPPPAAPSARIISRRRTMSKNSPLSIIPLPSVSKVRSIRAASRVFVSTPK